MPPTKRIAPTDLDGPITLILVIGSSKLTSEIRKSSEITTGTGTTRSIVTPIAMTGMTGTAGGTSEMAEIAGVTGMIVEITLMIDRWLTSWLERWLGGPV